MEHFTKILITGIAATVAVVLIFIGIKRLKIQREKYGLFLTTLLIAFSFYSCSETQSQSKSKEEVFTDGRNCKNIETLLKSDGWKKFRIFWKELDAVSPNKPGDGYFPGPYYQNLRPGEADTLLVTLNGIIEKLKNNETEFKSEFELFHNLCRSRIDYMTYGNTVLMTRSAPTLEDSNKMECLIRLENRTDQLLMLKQNGVINDEQFTAACENIKESIITFSMQKVINLNLFHFFKTVGNTNHTGMYSHDDPDYFYQIIKSTKNIYEDYIKQLEEKKKNGTLSEEEKLNYEGNIDKYNEIKDELHELKRVMPSFEKLILDLTGHEARNNERISKIERTEAFNNFKEFWSELNNMDRLVNDDDTRILNISRYDSLAIKFETRLKENITSLEKTGLFTTIEIGVINRFCKERIDSQFPQEDIILPVMHVIPPPVPNKVYHDNIRDCMYDLEFKIDSLIVLKQKNLINNNDFNCAIENLSNYVENIVITSVITNWHSHPGHEFSNYYENSTAGNTKRLYHDYYTRKTGNYIDDAQLDKLFRNTNDMITKARHVIPFFKEFIKSLEE